MAGHEVQYGKHRTRRSFSRIKEVLDLPNLIEIQTDSFKDFLDNGLREVFEDVLPITNFTDTMELEFVGYELKEPKYTLEEARIHDASYSAPIFVTFRLINKETGEIKTQEVFFGDFPIMTEMGTFIINGGERIIVSQLVRSPGVYFNDKVDKNGKVGYGSTVIPNRGAWLELETDSKDIAYTLNFYPSSNLEISANFDIQIMPRHVTEIKSAYYPNAETSSSGDFFPQENESDYIVPSRAGLLKLSLFPEFNNAEYVELAAICDLLYARRAAKAGGSD